MLRSHKKSVRLKSSQSRVKNRGAAFGCQRAAARKTVEKLLTPHKKVVEIGAW